MGIATPSLTFCGPWSSYNPPNVECGDSSPLSEPCGDESPHSTNSPIGLNDDHGPLCVCNHACQSTKRYGRDYKSRPAAMLLAGRQHLADHFPVSALQFCSSGASLCVAPDIYRKNIAPAMLFLFLVTKQQAENLRHCVSPPCRRFVPTQTNPAGRQSGRFPQPRPSLRLRPSPESPHIEETAS